MTELSELGFVWLNVTKFDSITNDSVKEILLPVEYDENVFKDIENEVIRMWPEPVTIREVVNQKILETVKENSLLQEAHENLYGFTRPQNIPRAMEIYKKESEKASPDSVALCALGTIFEEGKFTNRDIKKAVMNYMKSSKLNNPEGLYKIGKLLEKGVINSKEYF